MMDQIHIEGKVHSGITFTLLAQVGSRLLQLSGFRVRATSVQVRTSGFGQKPVT